MASTSTATKPFAVKLIGLLRAKRGMSRADFIAHYESHHTKFVTEPLREQLRAGSVEYRRNYVIPQGLKASGVDDRFAEDENDASRFDCMTELGFVHMDDFQKFMKLMSDPQMQQRIAEDSARFLDTSVPELVYSLEVYAS